MNLIFNILLIATFKDHLVGETTVADYLLFRLNKNEEFGYVQALGLQAPTDDINQVLVHIAIERNLKLKIRNAVDGMSLKLQSNWCQILIIYVLYFSGSYRIVPDFKSAAQDFLNRFRLAKFGAIVLDKDLLDTSIFDNEYVNSLKAWCVAMQ